MRVSVALAPSCLGLTQTNLRKLRRTIKSKLLIRPSPSAENLACQSHVRRPGSSSPFRRFLPRSWVGLRTHTFEGHAGRQFPAKCLRPCGCEGASLAQPHFDASVFVATVLSLI